MHRFILQPYKGIATRFHCPGCKNKHKTFVRYLDTHTNEILHESVGRCNRESSCGYHFTPKQYFDENNSGQFNYSKYRTVKFLPTPKAKVSYINHDIFLRSLSHYQDNNFVAYLISHLGITITNAVLGKYSIGTSRHWNGATVFWQIDIAGNIRTGKIMLYNPHTGRRVKEPFNYITWAHTLLHQPNFSLNQCLFGEHLLKANSKPVAIVESEKTAIIASVYLPQFIWLAVGSITNLSVKRCKVLTGKQIVLFPDLNGFEKWSIKALELKQIAKVSVSGYLEENATDLEKSKGLDIADYLIREPGWAGINSVQIGT